MLVSGRVKAQTCANWSGPANRKSQWFRIPTRKILSKGLRIHLWNISSFSQTSTRDSHVASLCIVMSCKGSSSVNAISMLIGDVLNWWAYSWDVLIPPTSRIKRHEEAQYFMILPRLVPSFLSGQILLLLQIIQQQATNTCPLSGGKGGKWGKFRSSLPFEAASCFHLPGWISASLFHISSRRRGFKRKPKDMGIRVKQQRGNWVLRRIRWYHLKSLVNFLLGCYFLLLRSSVASWWNSNQVKLCEAEIRFMNEDLESNRSHVVPFVFIICFADFLVTQHKGHDIF